MILKTKLLNIEFIYICFDYNNLELPQNTKAKCKFLENEKITSVTSGLLVFIVIALKS